MDLVISKISHILLLLALLGIVFILIQDPYIIEKPKISVNTKQASAKNITIYENSDKLLCKYDASYLIHYLNDKEEANDVKIECEKDFLSADFLIKNQDFITANGNVFYKNKKTKNSLNTQKLNYDMKKELIFNDVFTNIKIKNNDIKANLGIKYDKKNEMLTMQKINMSIKQ